MAYQKQNFQNGQKLKAEHLNFMEQGVAETEKQIAAVNLLDNSNFAHLVNQRGQTMYSGTAGYKIDRWRSQAAISWTVLPGSCLMITNTSDAANGIAQYLAEGTAPAPGEMVTLACEDLEGNVYCGAVAMPATGNVLAFTREDGRFYGRVYAWSETAGERVNLILAAGATVSLKWAALYKGAFTKDTLPLYKPRTYAQELMECQRYYQRIDMSVQVAGYSMLTPGRFVFCLPLPIAMRDTPTMTFDGSVDVSCNGVNCSTTPDGTKFQAGHMIKFYTDYSGEETIPPYHAATGTLPPALELSAEL